MSYFIKPQNYTPILDPQQTELGIQKIKDFYKPIYRPNYDFEELQRLFLYCAARG